MYFFVKEIFCITENICLNFFEKSDWKREWFICYFCSQTCADYDNQTDSIFRLVSKRPTKILPSLIIVSFCMKIFSVWVIAFMLNTCYDVNNYRPNWNKTVQHFVGILSRQPVSIQCHLFLVICFVAFY